MNAASLILWLSVTMPGSDVNPSFDWPQWRGPERTGVSAETGLLKSWPAEGPPLVWKTGGLGGGYSTPSVAEGKIFGMSYRGMDEFVWAIAEKDGKELWATKIATAAKVGYGEGSRSTPTIDSGLLYSVGADGDMVCLKTSDGEKVWSKSFKKDFGGRMMSGWGFSESPLVDGDKVIVTPGADKAAIVALNKKTGEKIWASEIKDCGGAGYSSIISAKIGELKVYVTILGKSGGLVVVNAADGKLLAQYTKIANKTANIPTVIARGDLLFASTGYGDGGTAVLKMTAKSDKVELEEISYHPAKELQNHHGGMVLIGKHVYMGKAHNQGHPACVEFATGKIIWEESRGAGKGSGSAALTAAEGLLYFRYQNGEMALMEATPEKFNLVSTFRLPEPSNKPSWPHPVIANGKLYIRDQDKMFCFNLKAAK